MNNVLVLVLALVGGGALGGVFFGGLWWTLRRLPTSRRPALLLLTSTLLRMSVAVAGFYVAVHVSLAALLVNLTGFVVMRMMLTRRLREQAVVAHVREASHAS